MATKIYKQGGAILIENTQGTNDKQIINPSAFDWSIDSNGIYTVRDKIQNQSYTLGVLADILDKNDAVFQSSSDLESFLNRLTNYTDVNIQDQYTPTVIVRFNKINVKTTLASPSVLNEYTITVSDATGITIGNYLILFSNVINRYSVFYVLNVVGSVITLDSAIDVVYPAGANVDVGITNMNQNGSVTPVIFGIRGTEVGNEVQTTIDITRIIFECITTNAVDLAKFGDLTALTRGLLLRKRDGDVRNIFNVKTNGQIAGVVMDWIPYSSTNPVQGVNGFTARLTFSGQEKLGVVQRLMPGDDLEFWIQDDLRLLIKLNVIAEGHIVED